MRRRIFPENFFLCGLVGLFLEIAFTGCGAALNHDYRLTGHSSVLMFPIYGAAALIGPVSRLLRRATPILRGTIYMTGIFCAEFFSGRFLKKRGICPWDYSGEPSNIQGLIRLDYAPLWFLTGLLFEHLLRPGFPSGSASRSAAKST